MDLSIIIISYNTRELLKNCLESVFCHTTGLTYEVIVVDNASKDDSVKSVNEFISSRVKIEKNPKLVNSLTGQLRLIVNEKNLGFAAANNQALRQARGDYILLLNSDTLLKENAIKKLVDFVKDKPKIGVVGPKLLNKDGSAQPSAAPFFTLKNVILWLFTGDRFLYRSPSVPAKVDWVMGSAFLIKRQVVDRVGGLDENFFMYIEEQEWCYRIKKGGWQAWFYPEARIYHLVRGSSPEGKQKAVVWIFEGLTYFYRKHFAPWQGLVLKFFLGLKAGLLILLGYLTGKKGLRKTYEKAFRAIR